MAINFMSLAKSEIELKQSFNEYLTLCYNLYSRVGEILKKGKVEESHIMEINEYKILAKEKKRDLRDDCIWIISKDQPRANHLRFIIAVLYSIRDIERIAEQSYNILWYWKNSNLKQSLSEIINGIMLSSKKIFKNMKKILEEKDVTKHYETMKNLSNDFKEKYRISLSEAIEKCPSNKKEDFDYMYTFSIIMKYIDRTFDHLFSIHQNFAMIKNNNE